MIREIKFRAWYITTKEYLPVISVHNNGTCTLQNGIQGYYTGKFKNCIIEQFTGLRDKYNKEIYEGDIVLADRLQGYVLYLSQATAFQVVTKNSDFILSGFSQVEVIGDIHENPELMEISREKGDDKMKNNEPAFPCTFYDRDSTGEYQPREQLSGMSLRDYFAAKAMQGLIPVLKHIKSDVNETEQVPTAVAQTAYEFADAMIAERGSE